MSLPYESVHAIHPGSTPIPLNPSLLKQSHCLVNIHYLVNEGYRERESNDIAKMGTAVHKYCSALDLGLGAGMALLQASALAPQDIKSQATLQAICRSRPNFPAPTFHKNGQPFIEQELFVPWRRYIYNGQDYTICLFGTPDRLYVANDCLRLQDYKTSLYYKTEDALRKYEIEIQFKIYKWMLYEFGHMFLPLNIANLARDFKLTSQVIVAQIGGKPGWVHGPTIGFTPGDASEVVYLLDNYIESVLLPLVSRTLTPWHNGMLTNSCLNCNFKHVCNTPDQATAQHVLTTAFTRRPYGPIWLHQK